MLVIHAKKQKLASPSRFPLNCESCFVFRFCMLAETITRTFLKCLNPWNTYTWLFLPFSLPMCCPHVEFATRTFLIFLMVMTES